MAPMKYKTNATALYLSLSPGEEIITCLSDLARREGLEAAWVVGIGVAKDLELGFYRGQSQDYLTRRFAGDYEILSLTGNLSLKDKVPMVHLHGSFSGEDFGVIGGHFMAGTISAAGEFWVYPGSEPLHRAFAPSLNLHVWDLES
ncbi:MAG: DNA-binding protein [bacterium]|nr:DNA-binding protein [bacterium]